MSHNSDYVIEIDDLAVGLTRPPMIFGVSMTVAFVHLMIAALSYIYLRSLITLPIVGISFLVCAHLSIKEPRFLDIRFQQFTKTPPVLNSGFWGKCNSYSPE